MSAPTRPDTPLAEQSEAEQLVRRLVALSGTLAIARDGTGWRLRAGHAGSVHSGTLEAALRCLLGETRR
jgi:hypothetical protein